jgi:hypothetical protein
VFGVIALVAAWLALVEAQKQARENAKTAKAQFWIMLREVFASYDDIHDNFRPEGNWFRAADLPKEPGDKGRTELYMGLFEYCDRLLEEELIDMEAFEAPYAYRLKNILENPWVIQAKLIDHRHGWRGFINLCYRLPKVLEKKPIPGVGPLSEDEHSQLYPKRKASRRLFDFFH